MHYHNLRRQVIWSIITEEEILGQDPKKTTSEEGVDHTTPIAQTA